jgi:hypothetical protein
MVVLYILIFKISGLQTEDQKGSAPNDKNQPLCAAIHLLYVAQRNTTGHTELVTTAPRAIC